MNCRSIIFLGCVLSIGSPTLALAAKGDPCTSDGTLKRWAQKYYDADYCAPAATNTAPTVSISSPVSGSQVAVGDAVNFKASASDKEDGDMTSQVLWYSSKDGWLDASTTLSVGDHTITAGVKDSGGLVTTDTIQLSVVEKTNTAPSVAITSPSSQTEVTNDKVITLSASASDAEDGNLSTKVQWYSSVDGNIASSTTLSVGTHTITASVTDSGSLTAKDSIVVYVSEPVVYTEPTVSIVYPASGTHVEVGTTITMKASATDDTGSDVSGDLRWYSTVDGWISNSATLSQGQHTIYAGIVDNNTVIAKDSITLYVDASTAAADSAPSVAIDSPTSSTMVEEGTALLLKASAYDAEDGDLTSKVTWYSSIDGNIGNLTTLSLGQHVLYASVEDSSGQIARDQISIEVVPAQGDTNNYTGSIILSWDTPTNRTDGSDLTATDLQGYRINWVNSSTGKSGSVDVADGDAIHYEFDNLQSGSYLFTLNSIDRNGLISSDSEEFSIYLN